MPSKKDSVRIIKIFITAIVGLILILLFLSFLLPWYRYHLNGIKGSETFHGRTLKPFGLEGETLTWSDSKSPHLFALYTVLIFFFLFFFCKAFPLTSSKVTMVIMIVTFLVVVLAFGLMLLACLGRYFSLTQKMAYRFLKKKLKKIAWVVSIVQFCFLAFGILLYAFEHAGAFAKDWSAQNGYCTSMICSKFSGSGFGPGEGWYLACVALALTLLQNVLVGLYALNLMRKFVKYERISSW